MHTESWRCFAEYSQGQWIGWCVGLGVGERGDSFHEVRARLASTVGRDVQRTMLSRSSLARLRVRYALLRAASAVHPHLAKAMFRHGRCFDVPSRAGNDRRCQVSRNGLRMPGFGWWERVGPWIEEHELARWKRLLPNGDRAGPMGRL